MYTRHFPANIYLFKVNNRNNRICSKLTTKKIERRHWHRSGILLLTLNIFHTFFLMFLVLTLIKWKLAGFSIPQKHLNDYQKTFHDIAKGYEKN